MTLRIRLGFTRMQWSADPDYRQNDTMKYHPVLVVEVMSQSTRNYDRGGKFAVYRQLSSLREYVLVEPQ